MGGHELRSHLLHSAGRLTDHGQGAHDGVLDELIFLEPLQILYASRVAPRPLDRIGDVLEIIPRASGCVTALRPGRGPGPETLATGRRASALTRVRL
jgi:hypothetical protein